MADAAEALIIKFGALVYFHHILNIFVIIVSMRFTSTPIIKGLMLLANISLLCRNYDRLTCLFKSER